MLSGKTRELRKRILLNIFILHYTYLRKLGASLTLSYPCGWAMRIVEYTYIFPGALPCFAFSYDAMQFIR